MRKGKEDKFEVSRDLLEKFQFSSCWLPVGSRDFVRSPCRFHVPVATFVAPVVDSGGSHGGSCVEVCLPFLRSSITLSSFMLRNSYGYFEGADSANINSERIKTCIGGSAYFCPGPSCLAYLVRHKGSVYASLTPDLSSSPLLFPVCQLIHVITAARLDPVLNHILPLLHLTSLPTSPFARCTLSSTFP